MRFIRGCNRRCRYFKGIDILLDSSDENAFTTIDVEVVDAFCDLTPSTSLCCILLWTKYNAPDALVFVFEVLRYTCFMYRIVHVACSLAWCIVYILYSLLFCWFQVLVFFYVIVNILAAKSSTFVIHNFSAYHRNDHTHTHTLSFSSFKIHDELLCVCGGR